MFPVDRGWEENQDSWEANEEEARLVQLGCETQPDKVPRRSIYWESAEPWFCLAMHWDCLRNLQRDRSSQRLT